MYFRGMTMNVLLPGATVSGDLLRGYELSRPAEIRSCAQACRCCSTG